MSRKLLAALAAVALVFVFTALDLSAHPSFGTTIDFLDYVFFDKRGPKDIYPLEVWEGRVKEMADAGFKRVYLRVNCCGVALYPTKVTRLYGDDYAWHWDMPEQAQRLTNTVRAYDVCQETIRLAHKYGMEAWCWESLADGGAVSYSGDVRKYGDKALRSRGAPFADPFFFDQHPECYAMRDPRLVPGGSQTEAINAAAERYPIVKITGTEREKRPPLRITAETVVIYISDDNLHYRRYDGPCHFQGGVDANGFNTITLSGLNIKAKFVKLGHRTPFPTTHNTYTFAMRGVPGQMHVFNSQGEEIAVSWHANISGIAGEAGMLDLLHCESTGWDYDNREIGFQLGIHVNPADRYHVGVPEYNVPLALKHQLERFAELAAYPFDGFMMNTRTHSWVSHPEQFGFNPEVREIYLKRYGKDIWTQDYDFGKLMEIRGEGIAEFYKGCKKLAGKRPFWISATPPAPLGKKSEEKVFRGMGTHIFGYIPWLYQRYCQDGSVDGVMMIGGDFSSHFTPEVTGGRQLKLGIFRECGGHLVDNRYYNPEGYDFKADMTMLYNHPKLDCVELYETLAFTDDKKRETLRQVILPK